MNAEYVKLTSLLEREHTALECMINAVLKYHTSCANAARTLSADLDKCKSKLESGRQPRPVRKPAVKK
jgi:hypothetical protein